MSEKEVTPWMAVAPTTASTSGISKRSLMFANHVIDEEAGGRWQHQAVNAVDDDENQSDAEDAAAGSHQSPDIGPERSQPLRSGFLRSLGGRSRAVLWQGSVSDASFSVSGARVQSQPSSL